MRLVDIAEAFEEDRAVVSVTGAESAFTLRLGEHRSEDPNRVVVLRLGLVHHGFAVADLLRIRDEGLGFLQMGQSIVVLSDTTLNLCQTQQGGGILWVGGD